MPVRLHTTATCDLSVGSAETLTLLALGDFEASGESAEALPLLGAGAALRFPSATRALSAKVGGQPSFWGYGERHASGLDVLLWPEQASCSLFRPDGADGYPGARGGQALVYAPLSRQVVAAGGNDALVSDAIVGALTFDVTSGAVASFDTSESGVLREPRAFASATPFGDWVLVAGGENPLFGVPEEDVEPRDNAELFDPRARRFVQTIELQNARSKHGAVTLADGRTLLVGGRSKVGSSRLALTQLELVDPVTLRAEIGKQLAPRVEPRVLRLTDGRIFVGGGSSLAGAPAEPTGEWLSAQAEPEGILSAEQLPPRHERAFAALAGGGVLAVGGCEAREPEDELEAARCAELCARGCPPSAYDAWWIDAEGHVSAVALDGIAAPRPILLPGSDGSPWLVAASSSAPAEPRLFRFDPWRSRFVATSVAGPLPRPGFPTPVAVDLDTFVWLDEQGQGGQLLGMRLGTRSRYAQDLALVLQEDPLDPGRPLHLVPHRAAARAEELYDGRLLLDPEAPVVVSIADTDYADVTVTLHLQEGSAPPRLLLGATELGGRDCPWPDGGEDATLAVIARQGTRAELRFAGARRTCTLTRERVTIAVATGSERSVIGRIDVQRAVQAAR